MLQTPATQPLPDIPKPKLAETVKRWGTVNNDTFVFKRCHFEAGNANVDGCDFPTQDTYPSAIAAVKKGERVALLSNSSRSSGGSDVYKVKFQQWTGWMDVAYVTPE